MTPASIHAACFFRVPRRKIKNSKIKNSKIKIINKTESIEFE